MDVFWVLIAIQCSLISFPSVEGYLCKGKRVTFKGSTIACSNHCRGKYGTILIKNPERKIEEISATNGWCTLGVCLCYLSGKIPGVTRRHKFKFLWKKIFMKNYASRMREQFGERWPEHHNMERPNTSSHGDRREDNMAPISQTVSGTTGLTSHSVGGHQTSILNPEKPPQNVQNNDPAIESDAEEKDYGRLCRKAHYFISGKTGNCSRFCEKNYGKIKVLSGAKFIEIYATSGKCSWGKCRCHLSRKIPGVGKLQRMKFSMVKDKLKYLRKIKRNYGEYWHSGSTLCKEAHSLINGKTERCTRFCEKKYGKIKLLSDGKRKEIYATSGSCSFGKCRCHLSPQIPGLGKLQRMKFSMVTDKEKYLTKLRREHGEKWFPESQFYEIQPDGRIETNPHFFTNTKSREEFPK